MLRRSCEEFNIWVSCQLESYLRSDSSTYNAKIYNTRTIGWQKSCFSFIKNVVFSRKTFQKQITVRIAYTMTPQARSSIAVSEEQHSIKFVLMVEVYHFFSLFYKIFHWNGFMVSFGFKYAVPNKILSKATTVKIQMLS